MHPSTNNNHADQRRPVPTASAVLDGDAILEMVSAEGRTAFALWHRVRNYDGGPRNHAARVIGHHAPHSCGLRLSQQHAKGQKK